MFHLLVSSPQGNSSIGGIADRGYSVRVSYNIPFYRFLSDACTGAELKLTLMHTIRVRFHLLQSLQDGRIVASGSRDDMLPFVKDFTRSRR